MTKLAECRFQYSSRENQSLSKVVLHFIDFASMGRGVVELARKVCKDEEAKFIRGHLNEYDQCKNILYLAENITNNGLTNTVSAIFNCYIHFSTFIIKYSRNINVMRYCVE